jgi:hypothetical protein
MSRLTRFLTIFSLAVFFAATSARAADLEIPLFPWFDQIGSQIDIVQEFTCPVTVNGQQVMQSFQEFGIYDTGASVVTFSAAAQDNFQSQGYGIPVKVPYGAWAEGVAGNVVGHVSVPGTIRADGSHVMTISNDFNIGISFTNKTPAVPNVQAFLGMPNDANGVGSESLSTITGTPIHAPSAVHPNGSAALITMTGKGLDLGEMFKEIPEMKGVTYAMPDMEFVHANSHLTAGTPGQVSDPVRIKLGMMGEDNQGNPGNSLSVAPNPVINQVGLTQGTNTSSGKTFLFDTGAMMSIITPKVAQELGINLNSPEYTIEIAGASGNAVTVKGYNVASVELPTANGEKLRLTNADFFVLDVTADGSLDGILGMNLFNPAAEMLYDPYATGGPALELKFQLNREIPIDPFDGLGLGGLVNPVVTSGSPAMEGMLKALGTKSAFKGSEFERYLMAGSLDPAAASTNQSNVTGNRGFLDVDGDGVVGRSTDLVLAIRYMAGYTDEQLIEGAVGEKATRKDAASILAFLSAHQGELDIDGDGTANPMSDGLLVSLFLMGLSDESVKEAAMLLGGNPDEIVARLRGFTGEDVAMLVRPTYRTAQDELANLVLARSQPVPEPSTIAMLVSAAACGLALAWRSRRRGK